MAAWILHTPESEPTVAEGCGWLPGRSDHRTRVTKRSILHRLLVRSHRLAIRSCTYYILEIGAHSRFEDLKEVL